MNHVDLFSGIGGFALASSWVWGDEYVPLAHSEVEPFPCKVYHKHFPRSECLGDITTVDWTRFAGTIDLLTGGFPCQPHSLAGKRQAGDDDRDLWGECVRALCGVRPRYALFENVPGLLTSDGGRFFNRVLSDLAKSGYDATWQTISACSVGAPHTRERVWIIANPTQEWATKSLDSIQAGELCFQFGGMAGGARAFRLDQPPICGANDGIPNRLDRCCSLGNAIVPQVAAEIMRAIKLSENIEKEK